MKITRNEQLSSRFNTHMEELQTPETLHDDPLPTAMSPTSRQIRSNSTTLLFKNCYSSEDEAGFLLKVKVRRLGIMLDVEVNSGCTMYDIKQIVSKKAKIRSCRDQMTIIDKLGQIYSNEITVADAKFQPHETVELLIQSEPLSESFSSGILSSRLSINTDQEQEQITPEEIEQIESVLLEISSMSIIDDNSSIYTNSEVGFKPNENVNYTSSNNLQIDADERFVSLLNKHKYAKFSFKRSDQNGDTILHHVLQNYMINSFFAIAKTLQSSKNLIELIKLKNASGQNLLHIACGLPDPNKSLFFVRCIFIELFHQRNFPSLSKEAPEKYRKILLNILQSKCKVMKKTPVATALYACNFATALMMMGGGKHGSDLNELVGINVAIKNDILEKIRHSILEEPSLLRYVAHNSVTVIHNLISLCRHETKNIFRGKRLVYYRLRKLLGDPSTPCKDSLVGILHSLNDTPQNQKLWRSKSLQKLISLQWRMFGAQHFAYDILRHVLLLIFTTYGYVLTDDPNKPLAIAFQTGAMITCFYLLIVNERKEFFASGFGLTPIIPSFALTHDNLHSNAKKHRVAPTIESMQRLPSGHIPASDSQRCQKLLRKYCYFFPRYFLSHHNVIDFLAICSIIFAGLLSNLSFYFGHEHSKHKLNEAKVIFSSIGCCLTWMMCLQLGLSCNRCVGIQLSMVEKMMSDVLHITGVMLLFITAFASFFVTMLHNDIPLAFGSFTNGLFTLFLALLGDYSFLEDLEKPSKSFYFQSNIAKPNSSKVDTVVINGIDPGLNQLKVSVVHVFFILFAVILNLILVNLLIALLSNTYESVKGHSEAEFYKRRSERILVVEGTLSRHIKRSLWADVPIEICAWEEISEEKDDALHNFELAYRLSDEYMAFRRNESPLTSYQDIM